MSCGAAGSGWRLWQRSGEGAEHPARVRARGEEETPAQSIRETGTSSKQTPPAAPRQPLLAAASSLTSPAAEGKRREGRWENGAASPRCPSPPRPGEHLRRRERRPAPQRGGGGSRGRAAARPRAERRVEGSCEGRRGGGKGSGESPSGAPRPQEPAGTCERCGRTLGRRSGKPVSPPLAVVRLSFLLPLPTPSGRRVVQ